VDAFPVHLVPVILLVHMTYGVGQFQNIGR